MPSDKDLLLAGKPHCFAVLYKRYSGPLYRYALMVSGSKSVAEEATQDTFVYMLENTDTFDASRSSSALGWLYGVLRNKVRTLVRQDSRVAPNHILDESAPAAEDVVAMLGEANDVFRAISKLNLAQREVIVLCGLQEVDYVSAAKILDIPLGTVRSRLYRARKNVLSSLSETSEAVDAEVSI